MKLICAIFVTLCLFVLSTSAAGLGKGARCTSDNQCADTLACKNRQCKDPCADKECAANTDCTAANHVGICSCKRGYSGHPHTECSREDSCTHNAECDSNRACRSGKCVNPCLSDDKCKNKRGCRVTSHVPDC